MHAFTCTEQLYTEQTSPVEVYKHSFLCIVGLANLQVSYLIFLHKVKCLSTLVTSLDIKWFSYCESLEKWLAMGLTTRLQYLAGTVILVITSISKLAHLPVQRELGAQSETEHTPSDAELKNMWSFNCTPLYICMEWWWSSQLAYPPPHPPSKICLFIYFIEDLNCIMC